MNEENLKILVSRDCDKENNIVGKGATVLDALEDANIFSICRLDFKEVFFMLVARIITNKIKPRRWLFYDITEQPS